jgi:type I restriction enzyme S subunit
MVPIGELVASPETWNPTRVDGDTAFTYIDLAAVDQSSKLIAAPRQVLAREAPSRARQVVASRDVLVSTVRPNLNAVAVVPPSLDKAIASTGFCVLRPNPAQLDSSYLFHWVKTPEFVSHMVRRATGASYPAISDRIVHSSEIPLPTLPEQHRVAAILDQADELRAKRRAAFDHLDLLAHSIFLELFGNPATNPKGWPCKPLGQLATKFSDGPFGSNLKSSHYTEDGVRVVRLQNIGVGTFHDTDKAFVSEQHFESLKKHECLPGDVLVGTMGDPNLRACVQPEWLPIALNKADCVQIRPDTTVCNSDYLCALLNEPETESMAHQLILGQTRLRISMGRLRNLSVPLPPMTIQTGFSERLRVVQDLGNEAERSVARLDDLFASLQHRAFRGEL